MQEDTKNNETVHVGDTVTITDEFGNEVMGIVTCEDAFETAGQYGVDTGGYGIYSRSADEIKK